MKSSTMDRCAIFATILGATAFVLLWPSECVLVSPNKPNTHTPFSYLTLHTGRSFNPTSSQPFTNTLRFPGVSYPPHPHTRPITVLLCLQTDQRISIPWTAIWTPLWCLDAVLLFMLWFLVALGRNKPPEGLEEEVRGLVDRFRWLCCRCTTYRLLGRDRPLHYPHPTPILNNKQTVEGRPTPAALGRAAILVQRALPSLPNPQARQDGALAVVRALPPVRYMAGSNL